MRTERLAFETPRGKLHVTAVGQKQRGTAVEYQVLIYDHFPQDNLNMSLFCFHFHICGGLKWFFIFLPKEMNAV